jgi:hypothetical protein
MAVTPVEGLLRVQILCVGVEHAPPMSQSSVNSVKYYTNFLLFPQHTKKEANNIIKQKPPGGRFSAM